MIHFAVYTLQYAQYLVSLSSLSASLTLIHLVLPFLSRSKCCSVSAFQSLSLSLPILSKTSVSLPLTHLVLPSLSLRLCLSFIRFCVSLSLLLYPSLTLSLSKILFINMINVSSYLVGTHFVLIYYCIKRYSYCTQECSFIPREINMFRNKSLRNSMYSVQCTIYIT